MGKTDVYESDYLENAEIFADLVNGVLYQGKQVVKPHELSEQDGELRSILGKDVKKTIRDKVRLWRGTVIAVLAVENQTKVDYRMVVRAMLAESMAYDKQWKRLNREKRFERLMPDEFISGMKKTDKFIPVITIVVYYGREKPWDGARTLYELLDIEENEEKILPFVSDYRLNLFDYHEYDDYRQFHSELQSIFEFLRYSDDKKLMSDRLRNNRERYEKLSSQAKILLSEITGIKRLPGMGEEKFRKGEFDMCKAFEDMKEEGRAEEIVETGFEFGWPEEKILERLQSRLDISEEKAREYLDSVALSRQ